MHGRTILAAIGLVLALAVATPAAAQLDGSMDPNYGSVTLSPNWRPNPHQVTLVAGGDQQAGNIVSGCTGWVTGQPDFRLTFNAQGDVRGFDISVAAAADTTLIVQGPDGQWTCNDDSDGGVNPRVSIANPQSGNYAIWVGTYVDEDAEAVLSFSEHP
jgi:hypothetical protein